MPQLSIIVPVYKTELYLKQCLDSILSQNNVDYEVILVDDGSPDGCPQICDEYSRHYDRIRVIHKENGGLVSARIAGINVAKGSYIGYVDSDDWIDADYFKRLLQICEDKNIDIVMGGFVLEKEQEHIPIINRFESGLYSGSKLRELKCEGLYKDDNCINGVIASVWSKVFKTELVKKYQLSVDLRIVEGEDVAVVYPVMCAAKTIMIDNSNVGYHYRVNDKSLMHKCAPKYYERICVLHEYLNNVFSKQEENEMLKQSDAFFFYMLDRAIDIACYSAHWNPLNIRKAFINIFDVSAEYNHFYLNRFSDTDLQCFRKSHIYNSIKKGRYLNAYFYWFMKKIREKIVVCNRR